MRLGLKQLVLWSQNEVKNGLGLVGILNVLADFSINVKFQNTCPYTVQASLKFLQVFFFLKKSLFSLGKRIKYEY
jgi:hypothetical protein